jgi:hypothetical protein
MDRQGRICGKTWVNRAETTGRKDVVLPGSRGILRAILDEQHLNQSQILGNPCSLLAALLLIELGADVNYRIGRPPLHTAAFRKTLVSLKHCCKTEPTYHLLTRRG